MQERMKKQGDSPPIGGGSGAVCVPSVLTLRAFPPVLTTLGARGLAGCRCFVLQISYKMVSHVLLPYL